MLAPETLTVSVKLLLRIVTFVAPLAIKPPIPVIPSSVKPLSPEPRLTFICGLAPSAARIVTALPVPANVP